VRLQGKPSTPDSLVLTVPREALFFDGYLPEWKIRTRLERTCRTSSELKAYFLAHPTVVPKPKCFGSSAHRQVPLFPESTGFSKGTRLPPPAFAVQAVLETLRRSDRYGPITELVPGEADPFCAEFARKHACVVLTSDSDLLVFDLGPDGGVVFFKDMEECSADESRYLTAQEYQPAKISETLGLPAEPGLSTLAFELSMEPHRALKALLSRARSGMANMKDADSYEEFMARYPRLPPERPSSTSAPLSGGLSSLDSRVSELVLQCLQPALQHDIGHGGGYGVPDPNAPRVQMFLPQLLDSWTRVNAWETSMLVRETAYCLVQLVSRRRISMVAEYARVVSTSSSGKSVEVPPLLHGEERCGAILALVHRVKRRLQDPDLVWIFLSMYWDVEWSKTTGKDSVVLELLRKETGSTGTLDPSTWNAVHWYAQIQGTYYSLRILKQVIAMARHETVTVPQQVQDLHEALSLLPPLAGFPILGDIQNLPSRVRGAGGLQLLAELTDLQEPIEFSTPNRTKRKRGGNQPRRVRHSSTPANNANPFAVLGDE